MKRWLIFLTPALGALVVAWVIVRFLPQNNGSGDPGIPRASGPLVSVGSDYYVSLALVEVEERRPNSDTWDGLGEAAPDLRYDLTWRNTRIFDSGTKRNTLIAKWSPVEVRVSGIALSGGRASFDDVVQAGRITIKPGEQVTFEVFDDDLLSPDLIGTIAIDTIALHVGETAIIPPASSIRRAIIRVQSMEDPNQ